MLNEGLLPLSSMKCSLSFEGLADCLLEHFFLFSVPSLTVHEERWGGRRAGVPRRYRKHGGKTPWGVTESSNCIYVANLIPWIICNSPGRSPAPATPHPRWRPCPEGRSRQRVPLAVHSVQCYGSGGKRGRLWRSRRKRRKGLAGGPSRAEVAEANGGGGGSERRWTTNSTRECHPRAPPRPTPGAGPARPRAPPLPPAAAPAPGGRDAMSHGTTHSPVLAAGARPGPEGTRDREVWAVGRRQSRTGESRGRLVAPLVSRLFWPFAGSGAGRGTCGVLRAGAVSARPRRCLCYAGGRGERGGQESAEVQWQVFVWAPWIAGDPNK